MHTNAIIVGLTAAIVAAAGCHDAPTSPLAPAKPSLAVITDGAWLVNSLADPGDGVCTNSECTLREAIAAAQTGDSIRFKSNLSGTIALTAGALVIGKSLTIDGPGPDVLTVDGENTSRVFEIGVAEPVIAILTGLSVTRGYSAADGGGISVRFNSRLVVFGSVVTGNNAASGGGIDNSGSLTLVGSTVSANIAKFRGGGIQSGGVLTVSRSTISGNRSGGPGGGIHTPCTTILCDISLTLRNSTVTANDAGTNGGGIFIGADAISSNTIIAGNSVNGDAGSDTANCNEFSPFIVSLGYTLTTSTGCPGFSAGPTDVIVEVPEVFTAVLQPVLADNGGTTPTHALIERGYAVDAGYCPGQNGDQRGFPRPFDDLRMPNALDACDIGAFEWNPASKTKVPKP